LIYRTIRVTNGQCNFTLRSAKGDRVGLLQSVDANFTDGRGGSICRNGSVLEVLSADRRGLTLRNKHGRVGPIRWADLPEDRGRIQRAYGYAMTIHTAQGLTNREPTSALPADSQAIDGFRYSAHTRHTQKLLAGLQRQCRADRRPQAACSYRHKADHDRGQMGTAGPRAELSARKGHSPSSL
jgi:hypothetical protein